MVQEREKVDTGSQNAGEDGMECVVVHFKNGSILKGRLLDFKESMEELKVQLEDVCEPDNMEHVKTIDLKAIYFVKDFHGNKEYSEKKQFGLTSSIGKRVMVRFKDGEILCGFVKDGDVGEGSSLPGRDAGDTGFTLYPADPNANNSKIFVILSSIIDIRRL